MLKIEDARKPKVPKEPRAQCTSWKLGDCGYHESGDIYVRTENGILVLSENSDTGKLIPYVDDGPADYRAGVIDPKLKVTITISREE